jgi:putative ABC transport system substrate-binding protein
MKRREFITLLGGGAAAWPLAARAQQPERMRRIGVLMNTRESDPFYRSYAAAFAQTLQRLGWREGENLQLDLRWTAADAERIAAYAAELVDKTPNLILASSTANLTALLRKTRTIPIIFVQVSDPVTQGFVPNLARPGGNITGLPRSSHPSPANGWIFSNRRCLASRALPSSSILISLCNPSCSCRS